MMLEPGERQDTPDGEGLRLRELSKRQNSVILVAEEEEEGQLVGYVEAQGGEFRRNRHSAYVVIGVREAFAGRGVGTALLADLSTWALRQGVHRLELTVMASNPRAIALYRKSGYVIEGTRRHSVRVGGQSGRSESQIEPAMGTSVIVVLEPLDQDALQVLSIDDEKPVEALAPGRANLALHVRICPGRRDLGPDHAHSVALEDEVRPAAVLGIVIVDHELRRHTELVQFPADIPGLPPCPERDGSEDQNRRRTGATISGASAPSSSDLG